MTARSALSFQGVWKAYPRWPTGARTARGLLTRRVPLFGRSGRTWALSDISFEVPAGSSLGIIGPNGAGKSTLLRLAAGLGKTTHGAVLPPAAAAAVLSLGDTLDPMLSGRENALTAALVDGWTLERARALMPAIAEFAELEEQIDAPVRTYSDGMKLRLAFAVVAQARPDALLVDEVLAVGDLAFQAKSAQRIREMREAGTTLVLASHDLGLVERECDLALWLDHGEPRLLGAAGEVVAAYREAAQARVVDATPAPSGPLGGRLELRHDRVGTQQLTIESVTIDGGGRDAMADRGGPLRIALEIANHDGPVLDPIVEVRITRDLDDVLCFQTSTRDAGVALGPLTMSASIALEIANHDGPVLDPIVEVRITRDIDDVLCFQTSTRDAGVAVGPLTKSASIALALDRIDLAPGAYTVDVGLYSADWDVTYDFHWHGYGFTVAGDGASGGVLSPPQRWEHGAD